MQEVATTSGGERYPVAVLEGTAHDYCGPIAGHLRLGLRVDGGFEPPLPATYDNVYGRGGDGLIGRGANGALGAALRLL